MTHQTLSAGTISVWGVEVLSSREYTQKVQKWMQETFAKRAALAFDEFPYPGANEVRFSFALKRESKRRKYKRS
jgi:hypothetical protein